MTEVAVVLKDLNTLFGRHDLGWYVFGAQAVVVFGRPRMTADVDATVNLPPNQLEEFVSNLQPAGFAVTPDDPVAFGRRTRVVPTVHTATGIPVDLVMAGPGLEQEFLERSVSIDVAGVEIPFITPEDLIVSKMVAGRAKDLDDVEGILLHQGPALDSTRVREVLGQIETALDRSDLIDAFDRLARGG